jgi:hypothetical protein
MFSAIRRRMRVTPATVIAGLALVFAMTGGAYAAKKYLITSTKQISPSVLKQLQGKAGAAGAPGAAGAQGAQGPAGPAGPAGSAGSGGSKGETGPAGVKGEKGTTGAKGATGATGSTGFTETLPSGKTETGTWAASAYNIPETEPVAEVIIPISFPIPLSGSGEGFVLNKKEIAEGTGLGHEHGCLGNAEEPTAPPGKLCVYTSFEVLLPSAHLGPATVFQGKTGYSPTGTLVHVTAEEGSPAVELQGTFAVTAP